MKFDGKGMKILNGKHIAFHDHPTEILPVGSRIIGKIHAMFCNLLMLDVMDNMDLLWIICTSYG
jgi:hypothetical protein